METPTELCSIFCKTEETLNPKKQNKSKKNSKAKEKKVFLDNLNNNNKSLKQEELSTKTINMTINNHKNAVNCQIIKLTEYTEDNFFNRKKNDKKNNNDTELISTLFKRKMKSIFQRRSFFDRSNRNSFSINNNNNRMMFNNKKINYKKHSLFTEKTEIKSTSTENKKFRGSLHNTNNEFFNKQYNFFSPKSHKSNSQTKSRKIIKINQFEINKNINNCNNDNFFLTSTDHSNSKFTTRYSTNNNYSCFHICKNNNKNLVVKNNNNIFSNSNYYFNTVYTIDNNNNNRNLSRNFFSENYSTEKTVPKFLANSTKKIKSKKFITLEEIKKKCPKKKVNLILKDLEPQSKLVSEISNYKIQKIEPMQIDENKKSFEIEDLKDKNNKFFIRKCDNKELVFNQTVGAFVSIDKNTADLINYGEKYSKLSEKEFCFRGKSIINNYDELREKVNLGLDIPKKKVNSVNNIEHNYNLINKKLHLLEKEKRKFEEICKFYKNVSNKKHKKKIK